MKSVEKYDLKGARKMLGMGIDIGTTTISVVMIEEKEKNFTLIGSETVLHHAFLEGEKEFHKIQDAEKLWQVTVKTVSKMMKIYGKPDIIGMTGQMHGIVYMDECGLAVSPFYTWQDGCGDERMETIEKVEEEKEQAVYFGPKNKVETYAQFLKKEVGVSATGYGLTTHFYLQRSGEIPKNARKMVTISDYIAMKFCGREKAFVARDMAASWGCFDMEKGDFDREKLEKAGVNISFIPEVLQSHEVIGTTVKYLKENTSMKMNMENENIEIDIPEGIPIVASMGDNQASVLGSVQDLENTVLINIGTGSQVSVGTSNYDREKLKNQGSIEIRPCLDKYLVVGSSLCGGRAYAMLEQFYQEIMEMFEREKSQDSYGLMERQARDFLKKNGKDAMWKVKTTFAGTRNNPDERGSIAGISTENFHPGAMTVGVIRGILEELYEMYQEIYKVTGRKAKYLVGSGNGIRKNNLMREMAEEIFQMPMKVQDCEEEAAYGSAVQALRILRNRV